MTHRSISTDVTHDNTLHWYIILATLVVAVLKISHVRVNV